MGVTGWVTATLLLALQATETPSLEQLHRIVPVELATSDNQAIETMLEELDSLRQSDTTLHAVFTNRHNFEHYIERPFKKFESRFWHLVLKSPEAMHEAFSFLRQLRDGSIPESINSSSAEALRTLTLFLFARALYRSYLDLLLEHAGEYVRTQEHSIRFAGF